MLFVQRQESDDFVVLDENDVASEDEPVLVDAEELHAEEALRAVNRFRVLTYNVNWGLARDGVGGMVSRRVCQAIRDSGADICVLQETHQGWEQMLQREVGDLYPYTHFVHCDAEGGLPGSNQCIFFQPAYYPGLQLVVWGFLGGTR